MVLKDLVSRRGFSYQTLYRTSGESVDDDHRDVHLVEQSVPNQSTSEPHHRLETDLGNFVSAGQPGQK